ncbi:MAG: hypothetical protein LBG19_10860 [Prevotellaceae bacterium]|jgi:hypothetical protein|nr:hypothetical protein [Prevotellaceae bacterium]
MKRILLAVFIIMNFNQTSMGQAKQAADSRSGVATIHNFYKVSTIPLYTQPEGTPLDVLMFKKKRIGWSKFYVIRSKLKEGFAPYELMHAKASAAQAKINRSIINSKNNWVRSHLHPTPIYKLSFKLIGRYDQWLKVELNSKTHETCYIRRNDTYMSFTSWEDIVKPALQVGFNGLPVYDSPNGKKLAINEESKRGKILAIEDEWMHIRYYYGYDTGECWVKWKDESGMLLANLIYEFIR